AGQTSFDTHPTRAPKGKSSKCRVQIIATLYTACSEERDRCLFRQVESKKKKGFLTVGCRGYCSSTRVGSVAPLGNTKEDKYYRNDSLKYCRHEEKKEEK
ncbi:hypothetical protein QBC42DRAFT_331511, partial [Cladorrhinum samala]